MLKQNRMVRVNLRMKVMMLCTFGMCLLGRPVYAQIVDSDIDTDGIRNWEDNCAVVYNPGQEDADNDGVGDVCEWEPDDGDADFDGIANNVDNCRYTHNPAQADCDGDGTGDSCDSENGTWVEKGPTPLCWIDVDSHALEITLEFKGEQTLVDVSACGNPPQYRKVTVHGHKDCDRFTGDPASCCKMALWNQIQHGLRGINDMEVLTMCDRHRDQNLCPHVR